MPQSKFDGISPKSYINNSLIVKNESNKNNLVLYNPVSQKIWAIRNWQLENKEKN